MANSAVQVRIGIFSGSKDAVVRGSIATTNAGANVAATAAFAAFLLLSLL